MNELRKYFPRVANVSVYDDLKCDAKNVDWAREATKPWHWLTKTRIMKFPKLRFVTAQVYSIASFLYSRNKWHAWNQLNIWFKAKDKSSLIKEINNDNVFLNQYYCDIPSYSKMLPELAELFEFRDEIKTEAENFVEDVKSREAE